MNDVDLLRQMRADIPPATRARLEPGRARLLAAISRPLRPRRLRRAMLPAGAAVAAAAVTIAVLITPGARFTPPAGAPPHQTPTVELLNAAAATVAQRPTARPRSHQWFYTKFVQYSYARGTVSDANWETFDGRQSAYVQHGDLVVRQTPGRFGDGGRTALGQYNADATPLTAYNALASLPTSPKELLAVIARQVARLGAPQVEEGSIIALYAQAGRGALEFDYLARLLWNAAVSEPPSAEGAVFRAMAAIPGITAQQRITDATGRPAVGLSANGGKTQLLFDPRTYQVTGMRVTSTGRDPVHTVEGHAGPWPPKGAVAISMAWAQITMVSGPGHR